MYVLFVVLLALATGILGFRMKPARFTTAHLHSRDLGTTTPRTDLPAPVARYAEAAFEGEPVPVLESALMVGRGVLRIAGIPFQARFKFYLLAGKGYYHYIELMLFGRPLFKAHERYMDGVAKMHLPVGKIENDPKTNLAANLGLWAETMWLPSVYFTDPRVQWLTAGEHKAHLVVPGAAPEEVFTVNFDPATGMPTSFETLRWRDAKDTARRRWTNTTLEWGIFNGVKVPVRAQTQWDDDKPWAIWETDTVLFNVDVSGRLATFGSAYQD